MKSRDFAQPCFQRSSFLSKQIMYISKGQTQNVYHVRMYVEGLLFFYSDHHFLYRVRKITYEGCTYREGDVVVLGKDTDKATPFFGVIDNIYYCHTEDKCFLSITTMNAEFHNHYHSYHLVPASNTSIITPQDLYTPHALNIHTCFAQQLTQHKFVCLKFHV